jgi:uncharacterized membrane protein YbhN (UPF0104 family)
MPTKQLVCVCFVSFFFSQFLPGSVGGDIYKWSVLAKAFKDKKSAVSVLLIDRLFGFFSLCCLAIICGLINVKTIIENSEIFLLCRSIVCFVVVCFIIGIIAYKFKFLSRLKAAKKLPKIMMNVMEEILFFVRQSKEKFIKMLAISFVSVFFIDLFPACSLIYNFDIPVSVVFIIFTMSIITILSSIPISFAGWGTREALFMLFGRVIGLSSEQALTISIALGVFAVVSSAIGGLLWVFHAKDKITVREDN